MFSGVPVLSRQLIGLNFSETNLNSPLSGSFKKRLLKYTSPPGVPATVFQKTEIKSSSAGGVILCNYCVCSTT